jgi:enamine deaminase RidA (YjgF/YER057c/UK114 family)
LPGAVERRLTALGIELPPPPVPIASFRPFRVAGGLVFLAGQTCERDGRVVYAGRVGVELDEQAARRAAHLCALNLLSALRVACGGDLDAVACCVGVRGFVQAPPGFARVPQIVDGASDLFVAIWGDEGRHARTSVGVSALPQNAAVEVDAIFQLVGASELPRGTP